MKEFHFISNIMVEIIRCCFCFRQVSHVEGGDLAAEFDCLFFEATAAEEYEYVESVFFGLIHEIQRDKSIPLPPLYISEEKSPGFPVQKRPKSPKSTADRITRDDKDAKGGQKKTTTSFKLFNKSFKIFN